MRTVGKWPGWPEWAATAAPHVVSWATLGAVLVPLVVIGAIRLLAEWQRRKTLVAVLINAPAGSVVNQGRGLGGPPVTIWVGSGPRPAVVVSVLVLPPAGAVVVLPPGGHRA